MAEKKAEEQTPYSVMSFLTLAEPGFERDSHVGRGNLKGI